MIDPKGTEMSQVFSVDEGYFFGKFGLFNCSVFVQQLSFSSNEAGQFLYPQKRSSLHWSSEKQCPSSNPQEKHEQNPNSYILTLLQSTRINKI